MREELEREYVEYMRARLHGLRALGYLLCGDFDRGDDVVQTAITKVYVRWPHVRSANNIDAYVRKVVVRTFLSEQRRPWACCEALAGRVGVRSRHGASPRRHRRGGGQPLPGVP